MLPRIALKPWNMLAISGLAVFLPRLAQYDFQVPVSFYKSAELYLVKYVHPGKGDMWADMVACISTVTMLQQHFRADHFAS